jgi:hypothetical protein
MNIPTAPTDSLYKFISIFCLGLIITCIISFVSIHNRHNAFVFDAIQQEYEIRADVTDVSERQDRLDTLLSIVSTAKADTQFFQRGLAVIAGGSTSFAFCFFFLWYFKEQRLKDELLKLTLKKARKEHDHGEE